MIQNYIGKKEPEFKEVIWYCPIADGVFEVKIWGADGWRQLVNTEYSIIEDLNEEIARAKEAEKAVSDGLKTETTRAKDVENNLAGAITQESNRAQEAEEVNRDLVNTEKNRAINAEQQLQSNIDTVANKLGSKIVLIEQDEYDALPSYSQDTMYFIYTPINYTLIEKPVDREFTEDGLLHTLVSTEQYTVSGSGGIAAGTYKFTVSLNYDPVTNVGYKWADGTKDPIEVTYIINPVYQNWYFGDKFPVVFRGFFKFGDSFPIIFS